MEFYEPIFRKLSAHPNSSALIQEHHVEGLFYQRFNHLECLTQYKKQWIHNQVIVSELEELNQLAKKQNATATILKGAHLLFDLYEDPGERFLSDIDLLIPGHEILKWEKILITHGFERMNQKTFYGNHFKVEWCKKIEEVEINLEIHTRLFFHTKENQWQLVPSQFTNLFKLSYEDLFLHLCGHLALQHNFIKINWLCDIYFYYQKHENKIDWCELRRRSKDLQLYNSIQMCLWVLQIHFKLKIEEKVLNLFEINKKRWWNNFLTIDFLLKPEEKKLSYFLIKHATKDHLTSALRYDLEWFYHYKLKNILIKK